MANFKTVEATAQAAAATNGAAMADGNKTSQNIQSARVSYTLLGTEANGDVLTLLKLGPGCTLLPHLCATYSADPGTTLTGIVGISTDTDAYSTTIDQSAGGTVRFVPTVRAAELTEPTDVNYSIVGAAALTPGVVIHFDLVWATRH